MTINGPAPIMLAMFLNTAIDQQVEKYTGEKRQATPSADEYEKIKAMVLENVRGTVQADILKEDQGQNTCIFSIDFALKMMGDIQEYFIEKKRSQFLLGIHFRIPYCRRRGPTPSVSWHLPWPTALPIWSTTCPGACPWTAFAPNLSFFFSNGMDPEYTVIGRVARRIWAVALREKYGASVRSQMLKYHIQTSGRSLHSQDIQFNDIRTTLQALCAIYDNAQSLHTNGLRRGHHHAHGRIRAPRLGHPADHQP